MVSVSEWYPQTRYPNGMENRDQNIRIVTARQDSQTVEELKAVSEILTDHPGIKPKWAKKGVILYGDDEVTFKEFDQKSI